MNTDINSLWVELMVEELVRHGADMFFLAPGSRCAPLTLAIARNERAKVVQHVDERGLAFAAVGYARGCNRPGVLVTTSGTAVANLFPGVIEASIDELPMIVLCADRPPELRDSSANQSIDQVKIFGSYTRWFTDMPCPTTDIDPAFVLTTVAEVVRRAGRGPVHMNCMFREPLSPDPSQAVREDYAKSIAEWQSSALPYTSNSIAEARISKEDAEALARVIESHERGIILAGAGAADSNAQSILDLASAARWPVLADVTSGLRFGPYADRVAGNPDLFFCSETYIENAAVECVLHLGGRVVSKRVLQALEERRPGDYVVISSFETRYDPVHRVTQRVSGVEPGTACRDILAEIVPRESTAWPDLWARAGEAAQACIEKELCGANPLSEPGLARGVAAAIVKGHNLFLGNSMPVRDMDTYAGPSSESVAVSSNRGASGIDGNIASAAGFGLGRGEPVTLILGDLAAMHDLNSLKLLTSVGIHVIAIIINNDGSAVFSFLPVAGEDDVFEQYFGTPHGLTFRGVAEMVGLDYFNPADMMQLESAYSQCTASGRSAVIEVVTERQANTDLHNRLVEALRKQVGAIIEKRN
jgi:2-succinyl-5-enolpyruvyl-6-hydroxy-3-cyclohexene-1-carboxylate synthase